MTTIPISSVYDNNFTNKAYTSETIANSISDGTATFSGGTIVNLIPPTDLQDAVSKAFVDGLVTVAPPVDSVQFNNLVFEGSSNLTFASNTLTVNGTINDASGISITGGVISGLNDPTVGDQIATKNYVDLASSFITNSYIQSDINVTYTASQMINGTILRNLTTDNVYGINLTDTTATAAQLVAFVPSANVGYAAKFKIMNNNPLSDGVTIEGRDRFALSINPGTGVTFYPSNTFSLKRGYILDCFIQFTNIIVPAVTIIINRCDYSGPSLFLSPIPFGPFSVLNNTVDFSNSSACLIQGNVFWNSNDISSNSNNYSYTTSDIKNQVIVRNPTGVASDILGVDISPRFMNQIMTIQNPSAFTITINGQTDIWNLIPTPITIPTNKQITMSIHLRNDLSPSDTGSYYNYGIYNTTGGTGTGLTVQINGIGVNHINLLAGLSYSVGAATTTNLTTPSATGLIMNIANVNMGTGAIEGYQDIKNYLNGGYQNGDIIQINGGDGNATVQLTKVNFIESFFVDTLGDGNYLSTDILTISGPGPGINGQFSLGSFVNVRLIGKFDL